MHYVFRSTFTVMILMSVSVSVALIAVEPAPLANTPQVDPLDPSHIGDEFLDTRITAGPTLRWLAEPRLSNLALVPGIGVQVAVSRRTWKAIDALWFDWGYGSSRARLDDQIDQRLIVQNYRGGLDIPFSESPWVPYAALGAGISTWELQEDSARDSDWAWEFTAHARWRWQLDKSLHMGAAFGAAFGPPLHIFNQDYRHVSLESSIGIGYAY